MEDEVKKKLVERFRMTTKRTNTVTLYLDDQLLALLSQSADQWKLSRNEAIIRILTAYFTPV